MDTAILFSLSNLGLIGGFTHCTFMCAPIVTAQVANRLAKIPADRFSGFERIKNLSLLSYHLGRITTYSLIGCVCSFLAGSISNSILFRLLEILFLAIAALVFLNLAFGGKIFTKKSFIKLPKLLSTRFSFNFIFARRLLNYLFKNPTGVKGYALGLILGFIPCGLLYSAFALAATITNSLLAGLGMWMFGIATIPALFLSASGGYLATKILSAKLVLKISAFLNALLLISMTLIVINKL